jgi:hypothetical protein
LPIDGTQDHGDHQRFSRRVALQRNLHLDIEAVIGGQEIGADQQQYDVGFLEVLVDCLLPQIPGADLAVVPGSDQTLSLEQLQMFCQFVPKMFVTVGIGTKQLDIRSATLPLDRVYPFRLSKENSCGGLMLSLDTRHSRAYTNPL